MIVGQVVGWVLLVMALYAVGLEVSLALEYETYTPVLTGAFLFSLSPGSLLVIQAHVWPWLWDPVVVTVLGWPAWAVFGVPGTLLVVLCGPLGHRLFRPREGPRTNPSRRRSSRPE